MNKENCITYNQSTGLYENSKGYSSRHNQIKLRKEHQRNKNIDVVPYRLQKAAITIQKFWRRNQEIKRRVYFELNNELLKTNSLLRQKNTYLDQMIFLIKRECQMIERYSLTIAQNKMKEEQKNVANLIKQLAATTFKMQRKILPTIQIEQLSKQHNFKRQRNFELQKEKHYLKSLIAGSLQNEEEIYLKQIKQENHRLLQLTKLRNEEQKRLKALMIQECKFSLDL